MDRFLVLFTVFFIITGGAAMGKTLEDVKARLTDPAIEGLYSRTYYSILERSEKDGFFQESVNGAYPGMFPRTVGGLASLYLETGEMEKTRRHVDLVLKIAGDNDMNRCAHVIMRGEKGMKPGEGIQPDASNALYRLDAPYMGCQYFTAGQKPVKGVYVFIAPARGEYSYVLEISRSLEGEALASCEVSAAELSDGWVRFPFRKPLSLIKGETYVMRLQAVNCASRPCWFGVVNEAGFGRNYGVASDDGGKTWLKHPGHSAAFALDCGGNIKIDHGKTYKILSRGDQVDGNLHVLASWAMTVLNLDCRSWEDKTYKQVAKMLDVVMDVPYKSNDYPRITPGLVKNHMLEHSREGRYWDCWDILTQSWALRTLELMQQVAERRGDKQHAIYWAGCERELLACVNKNLTMEVDGTRVLAEMLKADSSDGTLLDGMSWVNFATVASQYSGFDKKLLADTLNTYRSKADMDWHGHRVWGDEWDFNGRIAPQVIGKGVGWDLVWCADNGDYDRMCLWLDFIKAENYTDLYAEAFNLIKGKTHIQDHGNGEQCTWWCWGMARARKACGLPAVPEKK